MAARPGGDPSGSGCRGAEAAGGGVAATERKRGRVMKKWTAALPLLLALFTGCHTFTPEESAIIKEAQQLSDEVTAAYGVGRVRVIVDGTQRSGYVEHADWITIQGRVMGSDELRLVVLPFLLAHATLGHRGRRPRLEELKERQQEILAANHTAVEIMIRFMV